MRAGGIAALVALVRDGTPDARKQAAGALFILIGDCEIPDDGAYSWDNGIVDHVVHAGGVAALVGLAHDGTPDARSLAAVVLRDLGSNDEHRASMARAGAIPPMVALLREQPDHWHAEAAVAVLWVCGAPSAPPVVGFGEMPMAIVRAGGLPPLLAVARGDGDAAGDAAEALRDLAAENQRRTQTFQKVQIN